jgi:uncharacterized membrane protein YkvA (DUF1232 family)
MTSIGKMRPLDELLEADIATYEGHQDDLIYQAPAFYRLLLNLLDDAAFPRALRLLAVAAVAYFVLPADVIPEGLYGPYGYVDDIFLCALVAQETREQLGDDLLVQNWDGEAPLMEPIQDILAAEEELIGEQRAKVLRHIGREP